jgi:hypothetical protein
MKPTLSKNIDAETLERLEEIAIKRMEEILGRAPTIEECNEVSAMAFPEDRVVVYFFRGEPIAALAMAYTRLDDDPENVKRLLVEIYEISSSSSGNEDEAK